MLKETLYVGSNGLVGKRVSQLNSTESLLTPVHQELDITNIKSILKYLDAHPDIDTLVNFAAYTNVSAAQGNKEEGKKCFFTNVTGVENLVKALEDRNIFLIHISTDMVFPGTQDFKGPYKENQIPPNDPNKLTVYGESKRQAELITLNHPKVAIIRIIYPVTSQGRLNYLSFPLDYYEKNQRLYSIYRNQQMNMTLVDNIAETIAILTQSKRPGIYHISASDITTPAEIMKSLFRTKYGHSDMVVESDLVASVRYAMFGGLDSHWTQDQLGLIFPTNMEIVDILHGKK